MKTNRLIPMLPVKSMPESVDFYYGMLGFEVEDRHDDWGWAMLRFVAPSARPLLNGCVTLRLQTGDNDLAVALVAPAPANRRFQLAIDIPEKKGRYFVSRLRID